MYFYSSLSPFRVTTIAIATFGITKTIERTIEKRSHEQRSKTETKRLRATTFAIAKLEEQ